MTWSQQAFALKGKPSEAVLRVPLETILGPTILEDLRKISDVQNIFVGTVTLEKRIFKELENKMELENNPDMQMHKGIKSNSVLNKLTHFHVVHRDHPALPMIYLRA